MKKFKVEVFETAIVKTTYTIKAKSEENLRDGEYIKIKSKDYQDKFDRIFKKKERCTHDYIKQGCCDMCGKDMIGE